MQRRHGNGYVQRLLNQGQRPASPAGTNGPERPVEEDDQPTEDQTAAVQSSAQAAQGSASQAAQSQAQQNTQGTRQEAAQARNGTGAPGHGPGQGESQVAGEHSGFGTQEAQSPPGGAPVGESEDKAPKSPEEDAGFQSIVEQTKQKSDQQKSHPEAKKEAQKAQGAAEPSASEAQSKAQAGHVDKIGAAEQPPFDKAGFKAQLMQKIQSLAPTTAQEADELKSNNKLGSLKGEMKGKLAQEKEKSTDPVKQKTQEAPSTAGVETRQATPLQPPEPGPPPQQVNAGPAAPKPKTSSEVEKPLQQESQSLDEQMAEAGIEDEQLARSNEPEFISALDAKKEAKKHAQGAPEAFRQGEREQIAQAREEANASAGEAIMGTHDQRQQAFNQVAIQQEQTKSSDEKKRQEVAQRINGIFEKTKAKVDQILNGLDAQVDAIFDAGATTAKVTFENYVTSMMASYKQRRYGGALGWARWAQDKLLGMPAEVNAFYTHGRQLYLSQMDAVIDSVVAIISNALSQAKAEVVQGKQEIQDYVNQLPADLRQVGQEAAGEIEGRFDQLEQSIGAKQNELIDHLAQRYQENLGAIDAQIEEMRSSNRGLMQQAADSIGRVVETIVRLKDSLRSILARAASAVSDIIKDPIRFLGNLIGGIKAGLQQFLGNIAKHLKKGLINWLFRTLGDAGIPLPESFDLRGILSMVMRVLGLTWRTIRDRAVELFGEGVVSTLERVFDVFRVLKSEGIGGLFDFINDRLTGIKDVVFDAIRETVVAEVIQAGIQKLIGILGGPAGAFVQAVEAIQGIVTWFIGNAQQVASLVQAIMSSITAIASGAVGQAAAMIEQALARSIPTAISFLANLVGLGDLAGKIRGIVERVRAPVDSVLNWILSKATRVVRRLGDIVGGEEGAEQAGSVAETGQTAQRVAKDKRQHGRERSMLHIPVAKSARVRQANGAETHNNGVRTAAVSQREYGRVNGHVQRTPAEALLAEVDTGGVRKASVPHGRVQRQKDKGGGTNGRGAGAIKDAKEVAYDVSGKTLADLRGPLKHFGGHAAETRAPITIDGKVMPQKREDGTMFIKVKWITVDVEVHLPRWTDYKDACPAAQQEWDRFMGQTRLHEQQAHVDKAKKFVEKLGEEDTVIEGSNPEELKAKLEAKGKELQKRLQAIHDACDHGASVDALLHPEKGVCE